MTALVISVGTAIRKIDHPTLVGVTVDHDVPDLRLPIRVGYVDPPGPATDDWIAYFRDGGSMCLTPIEPGLWWAVATPRVDTDKALAHLGAAVKPLHKALRDSEASTDVVKLADRLARHRSGKWTEELAIEGDDTSAVVGIRGPGVAGVRARDAALSGQDLGSGDVAKAPTRIHTRAARKIAVAVAEELAPIVRA